MNKVLNNLSDSSDGFVDDAQKLTNHKYSDRFWFNELKKDINDPSLHDVTRELMQRPEEKTDICPELMKRMSAVLNRAAN